MRLLQCIEDAFDVAPTFAAIGARRITRTHLLDRLRSLVDGRFDLVARDEMANADEHAGNCFFSKSTPVFFSTHGHAEGMASVVRAHPGLTMIIDHLASVSRRARHVGDRPAREGADLWRDAALARKPGLSVLARCVLRALDMPA